MAHLFYLMLIRTPNRKSGKVSYNFSSMSAPGLFTPCMRDKSVYSHLMGLSCMHSKSRYYIKYLSTDLKSTCF